jgi:transposase
LDRA